MIRLAFVLASSALSSHAFVQNPSHRPKFASTTLNLFDKIFEEEGILGKGITVGKLQIALTSDRQKGSVFSILEDHAEKTGNEPQELARLANEVSLTLMRKSDDWISAASTSKWFSEKDAGKAESYYNDLANDEAVKYEKVRVQYCKSVCPLSFVGSPKRDE